MERKTHHEKGEKTDEAVAEQAVVQSNLLTFTDYLNFGTSSFSALRISLVAPQKNEEMVEVGRPLASGCTSSSAAPVWTSNTHRLSRS